MPASLIRTAASPYLLKIYCCYWSVANAYAFQNMLNPYSKPATSGDAHEYLFFRARLIIFAAGFETYTKYSNVLLMEMI